MTSFFDLNCSKLVRVTLFIFKSIINRGQDHDGSERFFYFECDFDDD